MSDRSGAIQALASEFSGLLAEEVRADVEDWCEHGEWLLALEVLAERLFEAGVGIDHEQRRRFASLVESCGGDESRFAFLLAR